jgi:hypothetical protein
VPENAYLLNRVTINSDARGVSSSQLQPYLRQQPNRSTPFLGRIRLRMYTFPDNDYTWFNRQLLQRGEPPVLFSEHLTAISAEQIRLHLNNRGYLNAVVDTAIVKRDKRANVSYNITANEPYRIVSFTDTIHSMDTTIHNILQAARRTEIVREGDIFDREVLEQGQVRLTNLLRNRGYFDFHRDDFLWHADTSTVGDNQVALTLGLRPLPDGARHRQFSMGNVTVISGVDDAILRNPERHHLLDTVIFRDIQIVSEREPLLRPRAIYYNTFLRPGRLYSDRVHERTWSSLNALGPVSQTEIDLTRVERNDSNFLDARIVLHPGNLHYMQFGIDGTNSAGDLGISTYAMYEHRNFFRGGERFRLRANAAYEFISASDSINLIDQSFFEYGLEASLSVPQLLLPWLMQRLQDRPAASTEFSIGVNLQRRPEYIRQFFNLSTRFQWQAFDWRMQSTIEPIGITYIRMPWMSDRFREIYYDNPILRFSYDEQSIVRTAYNVTFTNVSRIPTIATPAMPVNIRAGVEVAGWLPRIVSAAGGSRTNESGFEEIFGVHYAEYVRVDFDFATLYNFDERNTLAGRAAVGVALPYGNSQVVPFERRYFGGGANSVRGWNTRTLGPGAFVNREDEGHNFARRVGDIRFDFSVEYRRTLSNLFELATFIDAGNIWTIRDYEEQPGGHFRWNQFYREIGVAYGAGIRLNFDFLLLRVDLGMKAHNPALPQGERWSVFRPNFRRDFAVHFAIGYPF